MNENTTTTTPATYRLGKIARLPLEIRDELNARLADNEPAERLLRWLNQLPQVKDVLAELFDGRPISQQNLSAWKLGGYRDWERHQQTRARAREFLDEAGQLEAEVCEEEGERRSLLDRVSDRTALALLQLLREAEDSEPGLVRTRTMLEITRELARLRRVDQVRQRTAVLQERWDAEQEAELHQKEMEYWKTKRHDLAILSMETAMFYREYIEGLALGTISEKRQESIRRHFAVHARELEKMNWKLPEGEELEAEVAAERERLKEKGTLPGKKEATTAAEVKEVTATARTENTPNAGKTSPHKAAQGATSPEN